MLKRSVFGKLLCVVFSALVASAVAQVKTDAGTPTKKAEAAKDEKSKTDSAKDAKPNAEPPASPAGVGAYRPPSRGAPQTRVGGGTRGDARGLNVAVIAPDHTGLASTNQPDLYWFVSRPVSAPVEFVLMEIDAIDPLIEKQLPPPSTAGIQRISLADLAATLQPGKEYQWSVSMVKDANSRSQDSMAAGKIKVQPLTEAARKTLDAATPETAYLRYAEAGYWYDAISRLRARLALQPKNQDLVSSQAAFLEQVGLPDVARFERELNK